MGAAEEGRGLAVMSGAGMPEMNASRQKSKPGSRKALFSVRITTNLKPVSLIEDCLGEYADNMVQTHDLHADRAFFDEYFRSRKEAECRLGELVPLLNSLAGRPKFSTMVRRIAELDWSESWKKSFRTARVSRRIVIKPSWEKYSRKPGDCVINLDPGMSFGTGLHPTTRACLRFIDRLSADGYGGKSFLDAGCGSGVLAIAAAKLGFTRVVAVDSDPQAVKAARENCRRNGLAGVAECIRADLLKFRPREKFDMVAANMFESEHARYVGNIAGAVTRRSEGCILIAGTLLKQYSGVVRIYGRMGFAEKASAVEKGWKSGILTRRRK